MNEELKKYLESERKLNEQLLHNRELAKKFVKLMLINCLVMIIITIVGLIFFI